MFEMIQENLKVKDLLIELQKFSDLICKEYLGLDTVEVKFKTMESEALYNIEKEVIYLNRKNRFNIIKLLSSIAHELEHHWQMFYVANCRSNKSDRFRYEIENYSTEVDINLLQEVEIAARAFAKVVMLNEFNIEIKEENKVYEQIIKNYIYENKLICDE